MWKFFLLRYFLRFSGEKWEVEMNIFKINNYGCFLSEYSLATIKSINIINANHLEGFPVEYSDKFVCEFDNSQKRRYYSIPFDTEIEAEGWLRKLYNKIPIPEIVDMTKKEG